MGCPLKRQFSMVLEPIPTYANPWREINTAKHQTVQLQFLRSDLQTTLVRNGRSLSQCQWQPFLTLEMLFETTIGCQVGSTASTPQQFPGFETGIAVSTAMPSVGRFRPVLSGRSTNILNTPMFLRLLGQHLPFLAAYLPFNRLPTVRGFSLFPCCLRQSQTQYLRSSWKYPTNHPFSLHCPS